MLDDYDDDDYDDDDDDARALFGLVLALAGLMALLALIGNCVL